MTAKRTSKRCDKGHQFYKNSNCTSCPICEKVRKPKDGFWADIVAPARRALEKENIQTLHDLSKWRESDIANLHGIGPSTIPKLKKALKDSGLSFNS